jgi:malonyl-CoA/methylmalonyl-CoA synthetase
MVSALPALPVLEAISSHEPNSTAVIHSASGKRFTYGELLKDVAKARDRLCENACGHSIDGQRIAFLVENGYDYVGAHRLRDMNQGHILSAVIDTSQ